MQIKSAKPSKAPRPSHPTSAPMKQPAYFLAHGSPFWLVNKTDSGPTFLKSLGKQILSSPHPPKSMLIISAHWETNNGLRITTSAQHKLLYDYYGFPKEFYDVKYPAKGDPVMAEETARLLRTAGFKVTEEPTRGLDHGVFTPLIYLFPNQEIPIVQLSLPITNSTEEYYRMGEALKPLRDQGVMIVGSGFLLHNLRVMINGMHTAKSTDPLLPWAKEFVEAAEKATLESTGSARKRNVLALFQLGSYHTAHPSPEHFAPFVVAAGVAGEDVGELIHKQWFGGFSSEDSFRFGSLKGDVESQKTGGEL
ncbi:hypothetical protein HDU98_003542 [Podochytrium sp. JEL0797]|nr:hypothetical protein HDU98_003542 [Podochytrium sp. JEL0797]